jgi:uncharacterized protein (DUF924 family)
MARVGPQRREKQINLFFYLVFMLGENMSLDRRSCFVFFDFASMDNRLMHQAITMQPIGLTGKIPKVAYFRLFRLQFNGEEYFT